MSLKPGFAQSIVMVPNFDCPSVLYFRCLFLFSACTNKQVHFLNLKCVVIWFSFSFSFLSLFLRGAYCTWNLYNHALRMFVPAKPDVLLRTMKADVMQ